MADDDDYEPYDPDAKSHPCPVCKGRGVINPLTAPESIFVVGTTTCPECDGTGEWP